MQNDLSGKLLDAALPHVLFEGWNLSTFEAAAEDLGIPIALARTAFPRGAIDMAAAFHHRGDLMMQQAIADMDLTAMRYSARVAACVRTRLEMAGDKEIVRRGVVLFSLPQNGAEGAKLVWGTADNIWNALGDNSQDINWYSKRAILSGVYGSTVLFWLGDKSDGHSATWEFLDRRIEDVMRFEKLKTQMKSNPLFDRLSGLPNSILKNVKKPAAKRQDFPGSWVPK